MRLPDFAASDATQRFHVDLYLEHLEEASFLYEQRLGLYDDPEVTWLAIGNFESRLEAHLEALVSGEEAALEVCRRKTEKGDPGELYAAVCVCCRAGRRDLLGTVLRRLEPDDAARLQALSDAMKDEMSVQWAEVLTANLSRGYEKLIAPVAHYLGYRRLPAAGALESFIDQVPADALVQIVWALGRVGGDVAAPKLAGCMDHEDPLVRMNAAIALLRRGDDGAADVCRRRVVSADPAMYLPLAVSGGRSDAKMLQQIVLTKSMPPEALIALGVLGELGAVRLLVDKLTDEKLALAAATALQLITGAGLREDAFIPEAVTEDELFEDERQAFRETGEGPQHVDGRSFGVSVERISQNPDEWRDWLEKHRSRFDATLRYRLGKPFSLAMVVDTLISESFSRQVRSLAYEELVVRYGIDVPFEVELRVVEQKRQINAIARLCRSRELTFPPGQWYFAGGRT